MEMKKLLAVGVILLFIGVAVVPCINSTVVKSSTDNDLVEVTSQACGIQGFGNTTVKLTKQQYQDLEQYLVDFRARLNQTTTREEAIPLFKDAVVELNKYGLLPKGMSVEQAQRLVTGQSLSQKCLNTIQKVLNRNYDNNSDQNLFCLFYGHLSGTFLEPFYYKILDLVSESYFLSFILWLFFSYIYDFQPFFFLCPIGFTQFGGAEGNVFTIGLLGLKSWKGNLIGEWRNSDNDYLAVVGYTGLVIKNSKTGFFIYLGTAMQVGIHEV
jgi:hypothetical protein